MKYDAVIFDLDGVLCHTDKIHYQAWKKISEELGISFDEKDNAQFRGVSRKDCFSILMQKYNGHPLTLEEENLYINKKNQIYLEHLVSMGSDDVTEGAVDTLVELRKMGVLLAVGSSSKNAMTILYTLNLSPYFDAISDGNNISRSKPDPEVFLYAAKELKISPSKCLVVEDAQAGIIAAQKAGMDSVSIGEIAESGIADYAIEHLRELVDIVQEK